LSALAVVIVVIASHAVIDIMGYTGVIHVLAIIALAISASATVVVSPRHLVQLELLYSPS